MLGGGNNFYLNFSENRCYSRHTGMLPKFFFNKLAGVAELVYAYVSEAYGESLESSNLSSGTNINVVYDINGSVYE